MATRTVGPGGTYSTVQAAYAAAASGDVISINPAGNNYDLSNPAMPNITKSVTFESSVPGTMCKFIGTQWVVNDKAWFYITANVNVTFNWIEITQVTGFTTNVAAIRIDNGNVAVNNCWIHDFQGNGIFATPVTEYTGSLSMTNVEINGCGYGDGFIHNMYIGRLVSLTMDNCYIHDLRQDSGQSSGGNLVKSRCANNTLTNCRIYSSPNNTGNPANWQIDFSNGGVCLVTNCVIQQNANDTGSAMLSLAPNDNNSPPEPPDPSNTSVVYTNCTFVNDRNGGTLHVNPQNFPATFTGCSIYGSITRPAGTFTTLATRPTLDTSHPWLVGGGPKTITVGPSGRNYTTLTAAMNAANSGDTILIDAGTYTNNFFTPDGYNKTVSVKGVGGFARLVATIAPTNGKGHLVLNAGGTFENLEFVGATNGANAAGIRYQGGDLTCRTCWFHDCDNGILANTAVGTITLDRCEFNNNGANASSHNFYASNVTKVTATNCYFHHPRGGNNVFKSRALETVLSGCRFFDWDGDSNYSIDCPDGGTITIASCIIQQGAAGSNAFVIDTGAENGGANGANVVNISNCTFINDRPGGATFFYNNAAATATISNTKTYLEVGADPLTMNSGSATVSGTTTLGSRPFMDDSHPWDSSVAMAGVGKWAVVSDALPAGVSERATSIKPTSGGQTHVFDKPAGAVAGDRLIAAILGGRFAASAPSMTAPAGWTAIGTNPHSTTTDDQSPAYSAGLYFYYKDLAAGEPATYSWTTTTTDNTEGIIWCLFGHDPTIAPKISTNAAALTGSPVVANGVTATTAGAWAAHSCYVWQSNVGSSPPSNYLEAYEGDALYAADRILPAAGATGTTSSVHPGNAVAGGYWGANLVVVEATVTGGGGTIISRAVTMSGTGGLAATGRTVKAGLFTAAGTGALNIGVSGSGEFVAFGFGTFNAIPITTSEAVFSASGRGAFTAFAQSPGLASRGTAQPEAPDHKPIIGFGSWADIAIYSGGSWRDKLPLSNLGTPQMGQLARSVSTDLDATKFTVDIGAGRPVRVLGLLNHNIDFAGKYRLVGSSSPTFDSIAIDTGWTRVWPTVYPMNSIPWGASNFWERTYSQDEIKGYPRHLVILLKGTTFLRYWRVEIDDPGNPAGYIQAGQLFIGDAWQPSNGVPYGASLTWEDPTTLVEALSGAEYPDAKPPYRVARITAQMLSTDEAYSKGFEVQRRSGTWKSVLYIHDPSDTLHAIRRRFPARMRTLGATEQPYPDTHQTSLELKERLP